MEMYAKDIAGRLVESNGHGSGKRRGKALVKTVVVVQGQAAQTLTVERPHCAVRFGDLPALSAFVVLDGGNGDVLVKTGKTSASVLSANNSSRKEREMVFGTKVRLKAKAWVIPMATRIETEIAQVFKDGKEVGPVHRVLPGIATVEVGPDKPLAGVPKPMTAHEAFGGERPAPTA